MKIITTSFSLNTKGFNDIIDITKLVQHKITESEFIEGNVLVFVPGATAGITTIEYEPGLLKDYPEFMEKIIPSNRDYYHDMTWHDGNGFSHVRAAIQGASFQVPFSDRRLLLGTWQQIILIDFDNKSRTRKVITQIIGS
ncbi:MAG: secondary thiamine-phosphate synthase enzyme YjbQ [Ignavibacteriae bacterium]|nr:secondary thiamine-phosphate synthase enzyme YjbQ [Ignavibacteriota bacterium]MCB9247844.1 YjbQ family protein [Ignavibacteriales bacterium]